MTYGQGTYGQGAYGGTSFDTTAPTLVSISPVNGATAVQPTVTVSFVVTDPAEFDPWSLTVTIGGNQVIVGSGFLAGYGGSIVFNGQELDVSISTHPDWAGGTNTVSIIVTTLAGVLTTFNESFQAIFIINVADTVAVTDSLALHQTDSLALSDTITVTDSLATHQGIHVSASDTVTVTDALTLQFGENLHVADTVTVTDSLAAHEADHVAASDTVTVTDTLQSRYSAKFQGSDTVSVSDALSSTAHAHSSVADTVGLSDTLAQRVGAHALVADTVTITDAVAFSGEHDHIFVSDSVGVHDTLGVRLSTQELLSSSVAISESLASGSTSIVASGTQLTIIFANAMRIDGINNLENYSIDPMDGPEAFPIRMTGTTPIVSVLATGSNASISNTTEVIGSVSFPVSVVSIPTVDFNALNAGYLFLSSSTNTETFVRIVSILNSTTVAVDRQLITDPQNGHVLWEATTGVEGVTLGTTKFTNQGNYLFSTSGLETLTGISFQFSGMFLASAPRPQVISVEMLDSQILVTFSDTMNVDAALQNPREYILSGPGSPYIESVTTVSATEVILLPRNMQGGSYSLTVGTGTPHDMSGNPIDPFFNTVAFSTSPPIEARSIFTDYGPIARPALTLEIGVGVTFVDYQTVILTGASIPAIFAGYQLTLTGTSHNDGSYLILIVKTQNTVKVVADFNLPDPHAGIAVWSIVNPRDGEIADDPAHVTVTVNGSPVIPQEVVGLLGQIVLPSAPIHGQDVQVGYSWVCNPVVEIRRLNSKEFRLNSWNRDLGYLPDEEHYRFNNVLPVTTNFKTPPPVQQGSTASIVSSSQVFLPDGNILTDYAGLTLVLTSGINAGAYDIVSVPNNHHVNVSGTLNPADPLNGHIPWTIGDTSDIAAILPQPLLRDLKYRAYERAYTALLNDPNTLTLNAPTNLIAYPPLARLIAQTFVSYESSTLPENDALAPWTRVGTGSAAIVALQLIVTSPTSGTFPGGSPIYWVREVDQTFPHVFASTWDMQVDAIPVTQGVFTGVVFGYSDNFKAVVFGYLNDNSILPPTRKIGFLVKGSGNDPSLITAWTGGIDNVGNPTNAPLVLDWTILHSYRIYQAPSGIISLYIDGAVIPSLMVTQDQLPYLEELAAPFNALQGVYFGSLSAQAQSTSTWDFVRYLVLPLNPYQTAPSIFVDYVANVIPEAAAKPWTPVGYHGTETILGSAFLLLDSTSAVPASEEMLTGLVGGDFRGYFRLEPLIASNAEVVVDFNVQLRTWTQGFSPNAMMVAIDDSDRLIQLSFISDTPAPKFSYGGDGFPTSMTPPWTALGTQTAKMLGRTLQIIDTSHMDGLVYVFDDTNPVTPSVPQIVQESIVADSSVFAQASLHRAVSAPIVANSLLLPLDAVEAAFVAESSMGATASLNRGATATATATATVTAVLLLSSPQRVLTPDQGYILEARLQPISYTADALGFIGAMAEVYDSARTLGFSLMEVAGVPHVALAGDGLMVARFPFNWNDGELHTYRVVYSPAGVVTLFVDGLLLGIPQNYTSFPSPASPNPIGFVAFGSTLETTSTVNWVYCNAWRVEDGQKFVGIWRGTTTGSLIDYWVPTKATGSQALILGNALMDTSANFVTAGIQITDYLIVDVGPNAGIYQVTGVSANTLAIDAMWPSAPSKVNYRIAQQTDWTQQHNYRIVKAPSGDDVAVFLDSSQTPLIFLTYDDSILPPSTVGFPRVVAGNLPSIVWGAFDPTNLSQSSWQFLRYGVTRSPTELRIIPPHQVLNQRNVMQSYERHLSNLPHTLTDFWSESEGITPNTYPDFLTNPGLVAFTLLNEGTPLVPQTQTYEVRIPQPVVEFVGALNDIADVLNSNAFILNDATRRVGIIVPNDVLYSSLQIIERDTGQTSLIAPFDDECQPTFGPIYFQKEVCLTYDALTLPENDLTAITPWTFFAQDPTHVTRSVFGGVLSYGTDSVGTQTLYRNATPLPDAPSMTTQVSFRLKVLQDSSGGLGDSQIRFGFSAIGLTASLALVSEPSGQRYVLVVDQLSNMILGGIPFDFYDGNYHTYRLVRNPGAGSVQVFVDS